jgi:hypothetical protein
MHDKPKHIPPGWTAVEWCFVPIRLAQVVVANGVPPLGHNPIPEIDALRERIRTLEGVIDVLIKLQVETLEFNERVSAAHETARRILGAKPRPTRGTCGTCGKDAGGSLYAGVPMCVACYESVEGNPKLKPTGDTEEFGGSDF